MPHCGLETLLIQARSECVTLCIGELTRVCAYPPKFVLKSQDPLFHGDIESELLIVMSVICEKTLTNLVQCLSVVHIIGRLVSGNQDQNLVRQDRSFEIADNRLSSSDTATSWRGAI